MLNKQNGWTVKKLATILRAEFYGKSVPSCYRRNKIPSDGWTYGDCAMTMAVKIAGLHYNSYWSGSAPTPSTQWPSVYYDYAKKIKAII